MIYITLLNIAIFQGIVLGFVILRSSLFSSKSNKYLAYLLFTLSVILMNHVFEVEDVLVDYPFLSLIDHIEWIFLLPVFLYSFVVTRIAQGHSEKRKLLLYYLPFAYSVLLNVSRDLDSVAGVYEISEFGHFVFEILGIVHLCLALTFVPFLLIRSYRKARLLEDHQEKKWILILLTIISSLIFAFISIYLIGLFFELDITFSMSVLALLATFVVHWTAYVGIYRYKLAKNKNAIYHLLTNEGAISEPSQKSQENVTTEFREPITAENVYFLKLESLCKDQHIYTDSTLNREKVAEKLGISAGYLSQIVNAITGDNFANYINQYRVQAVKEMISDKEYDNYNLLAIGLEAGFTSKTTFYKAFKIATGQTPNEYKNTCK